MKRFFAAAALAAVLCASVAAAPAGRPSMRSVLAASFALHGLSGVDLSPSGDAVAWEERFHRVSDSLNSPLLHALYVQRLSASRPVRLTAGPEKAFYDEENPVWSPDGTKIAFLSDARSKGQLQVFVASADGGNLHQVGQLHGDVARLTWSPDGTRLAFLYIPDATRLAGALAPGARDVGVIRTVYYEQRLAVMPASGGAVREVSPATDYVYEYDWSPSGDAAAVTYAPGNGDDNWWIAKLARIDLRAGTLHDLFAPAFQIADPRWSPDGARIAVIGGIMSDFGSTGGDVYFVDAGSGAARDVTPGAAVSVQSVRWNDASTLDVVAHDDGSMRLMRLNAGDGSLTGLTDRPESLWSWSSANHGSVVALVRSSFAVPSEVWAGPPSALRQVSHVNAGTRPLYGKAVSLHWKSDSFTVQGWLVYPLAYDPHATYPMVTIVHGGPSAASVPGYGSPFISALASQGYFVFMPNPRGSFGQGAAFERANVKDFGYGDWRDDLAGVDAAVKAAPIDSGRLGLFGWSYGGYMGMWAETQTTRFKAIVAGAGVVNWQSYYGQNKIDRWMIPFFGASVYEDPAVYAKSSPITFILHSKTPVLILQGELDEEVPAPQAFEFWHAMTALNVPTKLIVYAGEGHGPRKIANQIDVLTQMVGWFSRYLGATTAGSLCLEYRQTHVPVL